MHQTKSSFAWHEHAPGIWQRDIDEVETFWAKAARVFDSQGRKPFVITGHLRFRIDGTAVSSLQDVNQALRKAWCRIRQDHPSIASRVDYDFNTERFVRIYHTARNDLEKETWLTETFFEISNGQSGVEFANSDPVAPELPTIFIITPPSNDDGLVCRDIVVRAPHDTIDGIGTLMLLSSLLKHASEALENGLSYSSPTFNATEIHNLSPPFRVAAMVPDRLNAVQKAKVDTMFSDHVFWGQSREPKSYLSLPFKQGAQVPGRHQRTEITLDQTKTSQIIAACKGIGVTVTHAFHAAIPFALRDLAESTQPQGLYYRCDLLRNLRPFCAAPFNTSKHCVTAYHAGSMSGFETEIRMQAGRQPQKIEFQQVLKELVTFYRRVAEDSDHPYLAPHVWTGWLQTLPKLEIHPAPGPPPSPSPGISLSSLGRVDEILPPTIGRFNISNPWITGEEMGNGYGLFLVSHRGKINLAAAYNDAWQAEEDAQKFLQACVRVLWESLELD